MEDLGIPPRADALPHSSRYLSLLSRISDAHARQLGLEAAREESSSIGPSLQRYLDEDSAGALEALCSALCEFNKQPRAHISWLQHNPSEARAANMAAVPLEHQRGFREMVSNLTTLASMLGVEADGSLTWAQSAALSTEDMDSFGARLRRCLASFEHYSAAHLDET